VHNRSHLHAIGSRLAHCNPNADRRRPQFTATHRHQRQRDSSLLRYPRSRQLHNCFCHGGTNGSIPDAVDTGTGLHGQRFVHVQRRASRSNVSGAFECAGCQWRAISVYYHGVHERPCHVAAFASRWVQTPWPAPLAADPGLCNAFVDDGRSQDAWKPGIREADGTERCIGFDDFLCSFEHGRLWRRKRRGAHATTYCHANGNFNDRAYPNGNVSLGAAATIAADSTHANSEVISGTLPGLG
jgi:hypothetical protein